MAELLEVKGLTVGFPTEDGIVHAVRDVSYELAPGEVLGVVGESGSGKSVSSMALMGLLPQSAKITGSIKFHGEELIGRAPRYLRSIRGNKVTMIFQDPMTALNPVYSVGWQLSEAVLTHRDVSKKQAWDRAVELLDLVGIPQPGARAEAYPHEFSGGMRQRAMIAMAIANEPEIIIADEPTTALDVTVQAQILELLNKIKEETHAAIILITHDLGVVAGMVDRMMVMYAGTVVESGSVNDVFYEPRMPYTVGLLGSIPRLDAADGGKLLPIRGAPPSLINLPPGCPFSPRCPLARQECLDAEPTLAATTSVEHLASCFFSDEVAVLDDPLVLFAAPSLP
jgi:peptide/nickel transport system ATP-binding protein